MTEIPEADKFVGTILFAEAVMTFDKWDRDWP
jgi:hypothetical protein